MKKTIAIIIGVLFLVILAVLFSRQKSLTTITPHEAVTTTAEPVSNERDVDLSAVLNKEIELPKLEESPISKSGEYALDCRTTHYSAILTGGFLIDKPSVKISEGSERQVLYVENKSAKFFGAEYSVIQDDESYLIIVRTYSVSGLTETVTINKEKGIGFDTKTMGMGVSGGPQSDTYILKCDEI
jgi:hypothetical protein